MSKDLQRDLSQKTRLQALSILVFIVAFSTFAAMTYVQTVLVPGFVENAVRTCANLGGLITVPLLLILGFKDWLITSRVKLPAWRNGLALSSMVLPSVVWLSRISMSVVSANPQAIDHFPHVDPLGLLATLLNSNLLAGLLAIALAGTARLLVLAAVFLLWAALESGIYFWSARPEPKTNFSDLCGSRALLQVLLNLQSEEPNYACRIDCQATAVGGKRNT